MRTTIDIADHLLAEAKQLATHQGISLTAILETSLQRYLVEHRVAASSPVGCSFPVTDAGQPVAGIDFNDTSELLEL